MNIAHRIALKIPEDDLGTVQEMLPRPWWIWLRRLRLRALLVKRAESIEVGRSFRLGDSKEGREALRRGVAEGKKTAEKKKPRYKNAPDLMQQRIGGLPFTVK